MLRTTRPGIVLVAGLVAAVAVGRPAQAQTSSNANVAAEALFEDARNLVAAGKYADACPKFAESQRLGPSVSTQLNLANCWEKLGRTASAWATYREAASAASAAGRKDYLSTALRRADALAPKLARLTVTVAQPIAGLQVRRDGLAVDAAEWGTAIPVDTGPHVVDASAPGHRPWSVTVAFEQDGTQATASVPALEELPPEAQAAAADSAGTVAPPMTAAAAATPAADTERSPHAGNGQRIAGGVVAGLGVAGIGVAVGLALAAKSKYNDSVNQCEPNNPNLCTPTGVSQRDDARSEGTVASVVMGIGAAAVVAGGIVFFTAPHAKSSSAALVVMPTLGGLVAKGAW
jgi:serine/threonine-protein kinase